MHDEFRLAGACLEGRYDVERIVTSGGFGTVYYGRHRALGSAVAIKVLRLSPDIGSDEREDVTGRFLEEARLVTALRHPAVVRSLDFGVCVMPGGQRAPWMALEWVDGGTLKKLLDARRGARMTPRESLALLRPVFEALTEAHAIGIAHRDIKPANIMVTGASGALATRVLDFGIAKAMRPEERAAPSGNTETASSLIAFSAKYAAPEQVGGSRTGPWTDVHALALVLVEALTGRQAFQGEEFVEIVARVLNPQRPTPAAFGVDVGAWEPVLAKALAFKPADRFAHAGELLAALDATLSGTETPRALQAPQEPAATSSLSVGLAIVAVLALLGGGAALTALALRRVSGDAPAERAPAPVVVAAARPASSRPRCRAPETRPAVPGLVDVVGVVAGGNHTCARLRDATLRCWGENGNGALGDGTLEDRYVPTPVVGVTAVAQVALGASVTCALHTDGGASCWGRGIVPNSGEIQNRRARRIEGVERGVQIAAGLMHACAVQTGGAVWCWGQNDSGQLGRSVEFGDDGAARQVAGLDPAVQIAAGGDHTCALLRDGAVWCWGSRTYGELGDGHTTREGRGTPTRVEGLRGVVQIALGEASSCARLSDGAVWCWGINSRGQVGGASDSYARPTRVPGVDRAVDLVAGDGHACARRVDGATLCWGNNTSCEMDGGRIEARRPAESVVGLPSLVELSLGAAHACGRSADGAVRCWGWDRYGQLGDGASRDEIESVAP